VVELPRLGERITFLHLDLMRVTQSETGVVASWDGEGGTRTVEVPVGSLAVLLLGPGCSVSMPALTSLHRAGTTVVMSDASGMAGYGSAFPLSSRAQWVQAQARMWVDPGARLAAARVVYAAQFPQMAKLGDVPLKVMRGMEGQQVRALYRQHAAASRLKGWKRETDSGKSRDPVNPLLNLGNSILYGAAAAACSALGVSPGLGVIHEGSSSALLFDLADVHKPRSSIPLAFAAARQRESAKWLRSRMRDYLVESVVLESMVELLCTMLTPHVRAASKDLLFDGDGNSVEGHRAY